MARRKRGRKIDGWVVVDKPVGITSTAVVARIKRLFEAQKAGHAGTLDPVASGCLPVALGEATKTVSFAMEGRKLYRFTVRWGVETDTDDTEGKPVATSEVRPDPAAIGAALAEFRGRISQVPPSYSAVKVAGERAYDLARDGEVLELSAREVVVYRLELESCPDADTAVFLAECGKGTYVRALARDLGRRLGTCGHVSALRRLAVGPFREERMIPLEKLEEMGHNAPASPDFRVGGALLPVETALDDIPALAMTERDAARLRSGQSVLLRGRDAPVVSGHAYALSDGKLVALGEVEQGAFCPRRVFNLSG